MRAAREGCRRAAGVTVAIVAIAAGFGSALALAGGALGRQVPTTTVTVRPVPSTTVTVRPVPSTTVTVRPVPSTTVTVRPVPSTTSTTSFTTTVTLPTASTTTATTPRTPPPAPPPAPAAPPTLPPPPPAVSPRPSPQSPPVGAQSPPASPPAPPSGSSPSAGGGSGSAEPSVGDPVGSSSGAAGGENQASTTAAAAGVAVGSRDAYRPPSQQHPSVAGASSPSSVALDYGASTEPVRAASGVLQSRGPLALRELRAEQDAILSRLGFPDFLREGGARAARRSSSGLPDVQRVLGEQATIDLGDGGGLTSGQLPLVALSLVLLSSLLLVGALLPPGVIARTPFSPTRFARLRQPLALAAIAILLPLAIGSLAAALS